MTSYEGNYAGTGELMRSDEMLAVMADVGAKALAYAEEISPVRTGRYKAGWRMDASSAGGPSRDRAEAVVANDAVDEVLADVVDGYEIPAKVLAYLEEQGRL